MSTNRPLLEICVDCLESIKNAIEGGADRLELCSALSEGGLTPSLGLTKLAKNISSIPIFAMIRIRGGNFVYQSEEIDAMLEDLHIFKTIGIDGFVFGALTATSELDVKSCSKIVEAAKPLPVTFHRAFDEISKPFLAVDRIQELGFARILTSGLAISAVEGADLIAKLIEHVNGKIIIIPGAGINDKNILDLRIKLPAKEFHGSGKKNVIEHGPGVTITQVDIVKSMANALRN